MAGSTRPPHAPGEVRLVDVPHGHPFIGPGADIDDRQTILEVRKVMIDVIGPGVGVSYPCNLP